MSSRDGDENEGDEAEGWRHGPGIEPLLRPSGGEPAPGAPRERAEATVASARDTPPGPPRAPVEPPVDPMKRVSSGNYGMVPQFGTPPTPPRVDALNEHAASPYREPYVARPPEREVRIGNPKGSWYARPPVHLGDLLERKAPISGRRLFLRTFVLTALGSGLVFTLLRWFFKRRRRRPPPARPLPTVTPSVRP